MEPIISDVPATHRNVPHDLVARLYREIGVSAVAAALGLAEVAPSLHADAASELDVEARQAA